MKLSSLFAPKRIFAFAMPVLATLFVFGLSHQTPVHADAGCVTAKTWIDPANGHVAVGNGGADDTQNLQDLINYAIANNLAVKIEPGRYRITKTLILALAHYNDQVIGFHISGIAGPNPYGGANGVGIIMDANSTTQPAVLEIGQGAFYDMTIANLGLGSNVPNYGTQYGLLFAEQEYSHVKVDMVTVSNVGTCFANVQGTSGGGNGEDVNIEDCSGGGKCFYSNNFGQSFYHRILNCQAGGPNGATAIKIGNGNGGFDLDIIGFSYTFGTGPLCNTFIENDGISGHINVKNGRIEMCDTVLTYNGGSLYQQGGVEIRGIEFDTMNMYVLNSQWVAKNFPLVDDTIHGTIIQNAEQYTNVFSFCSFGGGYGPVYPALSLTAINGDYTQNFFEKCKFGGFSNKLNDSTGTTSVIWSSGTTHAPASNQAALTALNGVVRDCRASIGSNPALANMP